MATPSMFIDANMWFVLVENGRKSTRMCAPSSEQSVPRKHMHWPDVCVPGIHTFLYSFYQFIL